MKILHVLDHGLPIQDGYSYRSQNILESQRELGLAPLAVTSPKHEADWKGVWAPEETQGGVRVFRTGAVSGSSLPFVGEMRLMRALEQRLAGIAARENPAVLHAHSPVLNAFPARKVSRQRRVPLVYEIRAFWEDAAADQGSYAEGSPKYRLVRALETRCCRRADAVVTICAGLRDDLLRRGIPEGKVRVVPNAVVPEQFPPAEPDEVFREKWGLRGRTVVAFLGSFYHFEGLDVLLEAAARLAPEMPELAVLLVGGGETEVLLRQRAHDLGLGGTIIFAGRVPHAQVPGVYALAEVLAYPRKPMRLTELVTPLKPLEAMAMGKALIASDVGGHRELVTDGETGLLHRAGDPEALAAGLGRLVRDAQLRRVLGERGRAWVRRERTWHRNAQAYAALYAELRSAGR
ncbi:MAG: TIGR04063 family PEP-CTERM/XrtA system glycosyltransferase [Thermodesulfobacteriota bacterium]